MAVEAVHGEQGGKFIAVTLRARRALDQITRAQPEAANLRHGNVDILFARQ